MKNRLTLLAVLAISLTLVQSAWAQWPSDPSKNLPLANRKNNDQVQPKVRPLPSGQWYVSWFDSDPSSRPPIGYNVYVQLLSATGVKLLGPHRGDRLADLGNSSTEDYGLDVDTAGNALLAFLDTREGSNQQITAVKVNKLGKRLWGIRGVQLTADAEEHDDPKITGTTDGGSVVGWSSNGTVQLQKLNKDGHAVWAKPVVLSESGFNYLMADLHASDNGSVIVSWERDNGFFSNHQLRANKISSAGKLLWGKNVALFDTGSLQFGEFPRFLPDGNGGAIFGWYTSSPALQSFAQHIRANGTEAFPHNGAAGSTDASDLHVEPSVSYNPSTDETFLYWTETDSFQFVFGVYGQKFNGEGVSQWGSTGLVIVPLGTDQQSFVENVALGSGSMVMWVDAPGYGEGTLQAARLDGKGNVVCGPVAVSSAPANKYGLSVGITNANLTAVAWADDRIGNNSIYIQNIHPDCSLGKKE
jgi:hypothetical protein